MGCGAEAQKGSHRFVAAWRYPIASTTTKLQGLARIQHASRSSRWPPAEAVAEWLLVEWPKSEPAPSDYWLSNIPPETARQSLVPHPEGQGRQTGEHEKSGDFSPFPHVAIEACAAAERTRSVLAPGARCGESRIGRCRTTLPRSPHEGTHLARAPLRHADGARTR